MPRPKPERSRAPSGSSKATQLVHHTAESLADRKALAEKWGEGNANEVVRRALREARKAGL